MNLLAYFARGCGRRCAASITAVLTGEAYAQSARIARDCGGPFRGYARNREAFGRVMRQHRDALDRIVGDEAGGQIKSAAREVWDEAIAIGDEHGYRNAQATVLAPTGTIAFMWTATPRGSSPTSRSSNTSNSWAGARSSSSTTRWRPHSRRLGYDADATARIVQYLDEKETIEGAPGIREEDLDVFDCAYKPKNGERFIHYRGHLRMLEATQPFISGAILKTINVPGDATVEDIEAA